MNRKINYIICVKIYNFKILYNLLQAIFTILKNRLNINNNKNHYYYSNIYLIIKIQDYEISHLNNQYCNNKTMYLCIFRIIFTVNIEENLSLLIHVGASHYIVLYSLCIDLNFITSTQYRYTNHCTCMFNAFSRKYKKNIYASEK